MIETQRTEKNIIYALTNDIPSIIKDNVSFFQKSRRFEYYTANQINLIANAPNCFKYLLEAVYNKTSTEHKSVDATIFKILMTDKSTECFKMLAKHNIEHKDKAFLFNLDLIYYDNFPILHEAVLLHKNELFKAIMKYSAKNPELAPDFNLLNCESNTLFIQAIINNNVYVVRKLLKYSKKYPKLTINLDTIDKISETPFLKAVQTSNPALTKCMMKHLVKYPDSFDINKKNAEGNCAIALTVFTNNRKQLYYIIKYSKRNSAIKPDFNSIDNEGFHVLDRAFQLNSINCINMFIDHIKDSEFQLRLKQVCNNYVKKGKANHPIVKKQQIIYKSQTVYTYLKRTNLHHLKNQIWKYVFKLMI